MRRAIVIALVCIVPITGCFPKETNTKTKVTFSAVVAQKALLEIQTATIDLDRSGILTKAETRKMLDQIQVANSTMKLVSTSLTTWNDSQNNATTVQILIRVFVNDIAELQKLYPTGIANSRLGQAFTMISEWVKVVLGGVK